MRFSDFVFIAVTILLSSFLTISIANAQSTEVTLKQLNEFSSVVKKIQPEIDARNKALNLRFDIQRLASTYFSVTKSVSKT